MKLSLEQVTFLNQLLYNAVHIETILPLICRAVGEMRRENRSTERKPARTSLHPPQIPHQLIQVRTWRQQWKAGKCQSYGTA